MSNRLTGLNSIKRRRRRQKKKNNDTQKRKKNVCPNQLDFKWIVQHHVADRRPQPANACERVRVRVSRFAGKASVAFSTCCICHSIWATINWEIYNRIKKTRRRSLQANRAFCWIHQLSNWEEKKLSETEEKTEKNLSPSKKENEQTNRWWASGRANSTSKRRRIQSFVQFISICLCLFRIFYFRHNCHFS